MIRGKQIRFEDSFATMKLMLAGVFTMPGTIFNRAIFFRGERAQKVQKYGGRTITCIIYFFAGAGMPAVGFAFTFALISF